MSQNIKAEDTASSAPKTDSQPKYPPPPRSISGRSTISINHNIQPPMQQPPFMPPPQLDWWNSYPYHNMPNQLPFDNGIKEEINK